MEGITEIKKELTSQQIMKFRAFYNLAKKRLARGEAEESAYRDKPEGYLE